MKKYKLNIVISIVWVVLGIIKFINNDLVLGMLFISIAITFGSLSLYFKKRGI